MAESKKSEKPICSKCGATGPFKILSAFGFGKYCVPCEDILETEFLKAHAS